MSPPNPSRDDVRALVKRLDEKDLKKIAVIDDAYDPPSRDDFGPEQLESFVAEVADDDRAVSELQNMGVSPNSVDDMTDSVLQLLWDSRDSLGALGNHCSKLFLTIESKKIQVEQLCDVLTTDLGRDVYRLGSDNELTDTSVGLVFVDYQLKQGVDSPDAALRFVASMRKSFRNNAREPLIVLISMLNRASDVIDDFRQKTGYMPGMFYFVHKNDLVDRKKFFFKLSQWMSAVPDVVTLQRFVDALDESLPGVCNQLIRDIKELSLGDYAFIQKLSLQQDGHPLGDYLMWLFTSYLSHLLSTCTGVADQQKIVDPLVFKDLPPSQTPPSIMLAKLYRYALSAETVDDTSHPRDRGGGRDELPFLHLGDLFISDVDGTVWMVINAQCDLVFTPDNPSRRINAERTVLMIPGTLQPLTKPVPKDQLGKPRTELFEFDGRQCRIIWDTKMVVSKAIGNIREWQRTKSYKRLARLRLPAALAVQQAFAAQLTRIGMPVAPPIYQPVIVELFCKGDSGIAVVLISSQRCALFLTRSGEHCILDEDFVYQLEDAVNKAIEYSERWSHTPGVIAEDNTEQKARIKDLKSFLSKLKNNRLLCDGFEIPTADEKYKMKSYPINVFRNKALAGQAYSYECPLVINVADAEIEEVSIE